MSYLSVDALGDPTQGLLPAQSPPAPKHFVVFPMEEPLRLPILGDASSRREAFDFGIPTSSAFAGIPLWLEVADVTADEITAQRDGTILISLGTEQNAILIPRALAPLVRVFNTLGDAAQHAQMQNALLASLHDTWSVGMRRFKLEAEAQIGRIVIQPAPAPPATTADLDKLRMDWLSEGGSTRVGVVAADMHDSGEDLRAIIDHTMRTGE